MANLKVQVLLAIVLFSGIVLSDDWRAGGLGKLEEADNEVQALVDEIRDAVETLEGVNYEEFTAINYREQIVQGTMFFVKIQVSASEFIHAKIYEPLPGEPGSITELIDVQTGKTEEDAIEYF